MSNEEGGNGDLPDPEDVIAGYDPDRSKDKIGDDLPDADRIIQIHDRIEDEYDLTHTGAAVAAPRLKFRELLTEVDEYEGEYQRAGALLRKIITAHYFEDGNKRTGWLTTREYLDNHGHVPADRAEDRVEHVLKSIRSFDVCEIARWLKDGQIDEERLNPR
jgi:death-on-curing protein